MHTTGTGICKDHPTIALRDRAPDPSTTLPTAPLIRPELLHHLASGMGKTTILLGPPGSGRSTVLSAVCSQMQARGMPVARLTLSAQHNEIQWLGAQLKEAFGGEGNADGLPAIRPGSVGVVDGLEHLHSADCLALMERFLLSVPAGAMLIASALRLRGAALHDGHMRGLIRVVGAEQLQFRDEEAAALLGPAFSPGQVSRINRFVAGWAAGLRFFALAGVDALGSDLQMRLPAGLAGYFDEVVCARIDPGTLDILCELAVLDRFTAHLLQALPDPPCSWSLVEEQLAAGLFLSCTDASQEWVAFQPAFGQHLRRRLRSLDPERHRSLQQFAASWFEQHGFGAEAMRHAVELPDIPLATRIIESAGAINVDINDGPNACLPDYLPPSRAAELPLLFMAQTYQRIREGRQLQAEAAFQQACALTDGFTRLCSESDAGVVKTWALKLQTMFLLIRDVRIEQERITQLTGEMRLQQVQHPALAGGIASILALMYMNASHYPQAAAVCAEGLALQPRPLVSRAALWMRHQQASVMLATANVAQARQCVEDAWRLAHLGDTSDNYEVLATQLLWGVVLYEDDQADAAMALIEPALHHISSINGWVRLYAESYSAAAAIAGRRGGWLAAERVIQAGEAFAWERNLPRLETFLATLRVRELARSLQWEAAMKVLSAPLLAGILNQGDPDDYVQVIRVPALLEAANLMMDMGQVRRAQEYLHCIDPDFISRADARLRLRHHLIQVRVHGAQRRWKAALTHLCDAVAITRAGGFKHHFRENATSLNEMRAALSSSARGLPSDVATYLDEVLPAAPSMADSPVMPARATSSSRPKVPGILSPRESQIMALIADGMITKEIAMRLGISEGTVKTHRKKIHEKLGVSTRSQAITRARERMII